MSDHVSGGPGMASGGLPLGGIRVLDFTQFVSGPHCSLWLASLGAEVLKIESPNRPDYFRVSLLKRDVVPTRNNSPVFVTTNLMKRSCCIDISDPEGQDLCHQLVGVSDVVVANFRPGVLEQFNLGYSALSAINPAVIMAAITGYGYTGEFAAFQALGPTIHAFTALSSSTGYPGGPPEPIFGTYSDVLTGQAASLAILAALIERQTTGQGCFIDAAMSETVISVAPEAALRASLLGEGTAPRGNEEEGYAPHGCYRCEGEDRWVAIATFEETDWAALTAVLELDACQADERFSSRDSRWANREELDRIIADATRSRNAFRLAHLLQDAGVAATPVRTAADLQEDDQLLSEGFMETVVHSELGAAMLPKLPWRLSTVDNVSRPIGAAPDFGEGTRELLQGILGLEDSTWEDLRSRGVVG